MYEIATWRSKGDHGAPQAVLTALDQHNSMAIALAGNHRHLKSVLAQLRLALGIVPSSERRKSGDPIGATANPTDKKPRNEKERLELSKERHDDLSSWHRKLANRHGKKAKNAEARLKTLEEIEMTAEEEATLAKENEEYMARLQLGPGKDPALESAREAFMRGGAMTVSNEMVEALVEPNRLVGEEVLRRLTEERTRYDFNLNVNRITIDVEKVIIKDGEDSKVISGSTRFLGPPKSELTWNFLSNLIILAAQYAMPFNRLGTMLSLPNKKFTAQMLSRWFAYGAMRFLPVYLHLAKQLANARYMLGDDTSNRVIEVDRYFKMLKKANGKEIEPPWQSYATVDAAQKSLARAGPFDLATLTATLFGFVSDRLDGNGTKLEMHTSVVSGRSSADDPRSNIVFYRSHFGGFGNMLNMLLRLRDTANRTLTVQSDLATVNLVTDSEILKWLHVDYAGCTSHARRAFAQHEDEDQDNCAHILHLFKGLYIYERGLDLFGRNAENTLAVRGIDGQKMWDEIKEVATRMAGRWSAKSKLGERSRYILRHFDKLTRYLSDPRLSPGNDFSERMLRQEKLIEANSCFRWSLNGRFALDINRSILQTAIAAHAPLNEYTAYVLKASPEEIAATPEKFTPLAFAHTLPPNEHDDS